MKKLVGSILASAILLAPTAAMADTVVGGSTSVVPVFVVSGPQTSPPADDPAASLPVLTGEQARKLAEAEKRAAKEAAKDAARDAREAAKDAREAARDARHELKIEGVPGGSSSPWDDAALIRNGGWKLS